LLLNKKWCTTAQVKQNIADTPASLAERGLVKVAMCTALATLPVCIYGLIVTFTDLIHSDNEMIGLTQNATLLISIAHPYIMFIVGSKVREHFANDWFFWK
jgi:hypothetical protein